jgi:predicted DNA-binding antitoxin AbrB/MazE fold protein
MERESNGRVAPSVENRRPASDTRYEMPAPLEAIYEHGVLRLTRPIDLAEGTRVEVIVIPQPMEPSGTPETPPRQRTVTEFLDELASMAIPGDGPTNDALDHDRILYGEGETG